MSKAINNVKECMEDGFYVDESGECYKKSGLWWFTGDRGYLTSSQVRSMVCGNLKLVIK